MLHFTEPVVFGRFLTRYKRFFMDVALDNGDVVTSFSPNTGSMMGLLTPNNRVMLTKNNDPARKTQFTAQAIEVDGVWVGINTHAPNQLVRASLAHPLLSTWSPYQTIKPEMRYGKDLRSRVDFWFSYTDQPARFLEIKNVTLKNGAHAQFPDSVSVRAQKHINELLHVTQQGFAAELLFVVQRTDCVAFSPARHVDNTYAELLQSAFQQGVKVRALVASIDQAGLRFTDELPCVFT